VFRTIAWATDGSSSALAALNVAERLPRAVGGSLVIVHVQELTIGQAGLLVKDPGPVLAALQGHGSTIA
jgi:nucleotide-binding universal stress UspA family protein